MKILLVSGPGISLKEPYNSGIETFIVAFANQLVDEGHVVHVIAGEADDNTKFKLINPFSGYRYVYFKNLIEQRQFRNLELFSYDIIHYNMFYPHLLKAGLASGKTSFLTLHSPADRKRVSAYEKHARKSGLRFVAISERIKHQWDQALAIDIPLINNGINMKLWPTKSSGNGDYLLWSGRITPEKNVASAISLAKYMQLPLKIAGRIVDHYYFDEQVRPHLNGQIQYVGHVTQLELSSLAKNASAYLATATWQEPFGLAALEMLSSGVPVVGFSTAVPTDWEHESVLTTGSNRWQDLVDLVRESNAIAPEMCKKFASKMTIQNMTSNYVNAYKEAMHQVGRGEEVLPAEDFLLETVSAYEDHINETSL